ncbi:hypothetical protein SAMN04488514_107176 [Kriegella aquimaris]|uniref:Uncharacterized protein n=1 Tax=Kriegella aquimaris TaxID=192904 RepID=A0A1G9S9J4_9FLAO|nr:hypothetical protein SAMN04488514_107176 [Kriegella aquimaris]
MSFTNRQMPSITNFLFLKIRSIDSLLNGLLRAIHSLYQSNSIKGEEVRLG